MYYLTLLTSFYFVIFTCGLQARTVSKRLSVNRGSFTTVKGTQFPFLAFNSATDFTPKNEIVALLTGDTLSVTIINNDTTIHGFAIKGFDSLDQILPGDSITKKYVFPSQGVFLYYDGYRYPDYRYLGLGGMITVSDTSSAKPFYWNIKEHQTSFNKTLSSGANVDWNSYDPDYFTINGLSHPDLQNDVTARVAGNVGDTIHIFVANTGQSTHSIHFHGFHCTVLFSTDPWIQVGSSKDTFPFQSMEGAILELVPDKPGKYSVHDHNLVAVSGGGTHPNGMFIIMSFQ